MTTQPIPTSRRRLAPAAMALAVGVLSAACGDDAAPDAAASNLDASAPSEAGSFPPDASSPPPDTSTPRDATTDGSSLTPRVDASAATAWRVLPWSRSRAELAEDPSGFPPLRWQPCPGAVRGCSYYPLSEDGYYEIRADASGEETAARTDPDGRRIFVRFDLEGRVRFAVRTDRYVHSVKAPSRTCWSFSSDIDTEIACGDIDEPDVVVRFEDRGDMFNVSDSALVHLGYDQPMLVDLTSNPPTYLPITAYLHGYAAVNGKEAMVRTEFNDTEAQAIGQNLYCARPDGSSVLMRDPPDLQYNVTGVFGNDGRVAWTESYTGSSVLPWSLAGQLRIAPWPAPGQPLVPTRELYVYNIDSVIQRSEMVGDYFVSNASLRADLWRISTGEHWELTIPEGGFGFGSSGPMSLSERYAYFDTYTQDAYTKFRFDIAAVTSVPGT